MHTPAGLSSHDARSRLDHYGQNALPQKKPTSDIFLLIHQFKSPLIYILFFAALISVFLKEFSDAIFILIAVSINSVLGFYQERKAEHSLFALKQILSPQAKVIRDGTQETVGVATIVPGDVIVLAEGDKVPADAILITAHSFYSNEALLTGESVSVSKHATALAHKDLENKKTHDISKQQQVFMGTTISAGFGMAIVTKTGIHTQMGAIAQSLLQTKEEETPLQKKLSQFARFLTIVVCVCAAVVFLVGILAGENSVEMFRTASAVAVAAIPEGMVISLTVILALGMQRILKRKALVRRLVAAETLGSVTVIATDKTGTLTEGALRVVEVDTKNEQGFFRAAILANNLLDPLELALWEWTEKSDLDGEKLKDEADLIKKIPFNSKDKFSASFYADGVYIIGAPEVVLATCTVAPAERKRIEEKIEKWGSRGLRLIALASKSTSNSSKKSSSHEITGLTWLGLVGFVDPIRLSVTSALEKAQQAGIRVTVVTGDYRLTAEAVLREIGIKITRPEKQIVDGDTLEKLSDAELVQMASDVVLFARVTPDQKLRIVRALQQNGEVVALLGDGVNDAPALKQADIGIVVHEATDVAKETADMVLLDSNFATIIASVEEGRGIFDNIRKVVVYLVAGSFSEMVTVLGSIFIGIPLPLTAAQILWINIVTDGFPNLALTVDPKAPDLLKRPPQKQHTALLDGQMQLLAVFTSGITGVVSLVVFLLAYSRTNDLVLAQTVTFTTLAVSSLCYVFSTRNLTQPMWKESLLVNPYLLGTVVLSFLLQLVTLYVPFFRDLLKTKEIPFWWWMVIVIACIGIVVCIEIVKEISIYIRRRQS